MSLGPLLRADAQAMGIANTGWGDLLFAFFTRLDFCAVFLFRLSSTCHQRKSRVRRLFAFLFWRLNVLINGCDIRADADIAEGFSLPHPAGVVIGPIVAGKNLIVHQNVTMGRGQSLDEYAGVESRPIIGNDVIVYAGAVIIGRVQIGDGAVIGANAVVVTDVPAGHTAFAAPARCLPPKPTPPKS